MTRPIILLDCDGPLADFVGAYLGEVEKLTRTRISHDDIDKWHIHECDAVVRAANDAGLTAPSLRMMVHSRISHRGWCTMIDPKPYASELVERLQAIGDVYIVTSPWCSSPTWVFERTKWCKRELGIDADHVVFTEAKHLVYGDIFVDDKPEHVRAWSERWPDGKAILFDMPHNRGTDVGRAIRGDMGLVTTISTKIGADRLRGRLERFLERTARDE